MSHEVLGRQFEHQTGHRPADREYGAPLHDVESMMPDYYDMPHIYREYGTPKINESEQQIQAARGNPDHPVTIYRATGHGQGINPGDWVTTSKRYAQIHGGRNIEGGKHTIEKKVVPASHLFTEGNSIHEWGYHPE